METITITYEEALDIKSHNQLYSLLRERTTGNTNLIRLPRTLNKGIPVLAPTKGKKDFGIPIEWY